MSAQRFTPEFKQEAVRQITEWSYSVAEVDQGGQGGQGGQAGQI